MKWITSSAIIAMLLVGISTVPIQYQLSSSVSIPSDGTVRTLKLYGINWNELMDISNRTIIQEEITDMKEKGFNLIRVAAYAYRFIDWENKTFDPSLDQWSYDNLVYVMNLLKDEGFWVEIVPMEPWNLSGIMEHWWTTPSFQDQISFYYSTFANWCLTMGWKNIIDITLWWEASSWYEWVDGAYVVEHGMTNYGECNADWKNWLIGHGITPVDLNMDTIEANMAQYDEWSRETFTEVTQLKANALEKGWEGISTGGEMGYTYDSVGYLPSQYLQLCAKDYVNVLQVHDYQSTADSLSEYSSYVGEKNYIANEVGLPVGTTDATMTAQAWNILRPKLDLLFNDPKCLGYDYWTWADYDGRKYGLKDANLNPRPLLDLLAQWNKAHNPEYFVS